VGEPTVTPTAGFTEGSSPRAMMQPVTFTFRTPGTLPIASQGVGAPLTITALIPTSNLAIGLEPAGDGGRTGCAGASGPTLALPSKPPLPGEPGPRRPSAGSLVGTSATSVGSVGLATAGGSAGA
jgi:hypothetical protein